MVKRKTKLSMVEKTCPECGSTNVIVVERASVMSGVQPVKYIGDTTPARYECKNCPWDSERK